MYLNTVCKVMVYVYVTFSYTVDLDNNIYKKGYIGKNILQSVLKPVCENI